MSEQLDIQERTLRRPIIRYVDDSRMPACPRCQSDVEDTLGAPAIPTMRLAGQGPNRVSGRTVNIRGFSCEDCEYVLAIAPEDANVDVDSPDDDDTSSSWVRIGAVFAGGSERAVIVPRREVDDGQ